MSGKIELVNDPTSLLEIRILEIGHTISICIEIDQTTIMYNGSPLEYNQFRGVSITTLLGGLIIIVVQVTLVYSVQNQAELELTDF